jgi:hypothetical protein
MFICVKVCVIAGEGRAAIERALHHVSRAVGRTIAGSASEMDGLIVGSYGHCDVVETLSTAESSRARHRNRPG